LAADALAFGLAPPVFARVVRAPPFAALDEERFALRRPGRERGRLPRTPGSSLRSSATTAENSARGGAKQSAGPARAAQKRTILGVYGSRARGRSRGAKVADR
jgi:hypothetical protein